MAAKCAQDPAEGGEVMSTMAGKEERVREEEPNHPRQTAQGPPPSEDFQKVVCI
jgi:hypothetical protein